jgi:hypothetical protein
MAPHRGRNIGGLLALVGAPLGTGGNTRWGGCRRSDVGERGATGGAFWAKLSRQAGPLQCPKPNLAAQRVRVL